MSITDQEYAEYQNWAKEQKVEKYRKWKADKEAEKGARKFLGIAFLVIIGIIIVSYVGWLFSRNDNTTENSTNNNKLCAIIQAHADIKPILK